MTPDRASAPTVAALALALLACGGDSDPEPCDPLAGAEQQLAGPDAGDGPADAIQIEYLARTERDELLLVVRPAEDWSYDDFRLFLGPRPNVRERDVREVVRRRDGGTTNILFTLDGAEADAFFPVQFVDGQFEPGPATLTAGGETTPLTRLDPAAEHDSLQAAEFFCRR
jgi:hypothetical protein